MSKIDLKTYINTDTVVEEEEIVDTDELLATLEQISFLGTTEELATESVYSQEAVLKELGEEVLTSVKSIISDLFSGSESVSKKYGGQIKDIIEQTDSIEGKEKRSISLVAAYIYNESKQEYVTDLPKILKSDINFIKEVVKLIEELDKANFDNLKTLALGTKASNGDEYKELMESEILPKLITVDDIFSKFSFRDITLYNSKVKTKDNILRVNTTTGKLNIKERATTSFNRYLTASDVKGIFALVSELVEETDSLIGLMKDLEEKYRILTGKFHKDALKLEISITKKVGYPPYASTIQPAAVIIKNSLKSIDRLPRNLLARNIKLMKAFSKLGKKLVKQ